MNRNLFNPPFRIALAIVVLVGATLTSQADLLVSNFTIGSPYRETNGSLSVSSTLSSMQSSLSSGGGWVVADFQNLILVGPTPEPVLPSVAVQPPHATIQAGLNLALAAATEGTPPFAYQWRKNGALLTGQTGFYLTIPAITKTDAGDYDVVVTSPFGVTTSLVSSVTVDGIFDLRTEWTPSLNPMTGLYEEQISITNKGGPITGLRLLVSGLPSTVSLFRSNSTNGGLPFLDFAVALNSNESGTFLLQFLNPYRLRFTNTVQAIAFAADPPTNNSESGIIIAKLIMDTSIPGSPRFTFGFASTPGRSYRVLHSDDGLRTWSSGGTVVASANWTIWTELSPATNSRFFKVVALQ